MHFRLSLNISFSGLGPETSQNQIWSDVETGRVLGLDWVQFGKQTGSGDRLGTTLAGLRSNVRPQVNKILF